MSIERLQYQIADIQRKLAVEEDPQEGLYLYTELERLEDELILEAEAEIARIEAMHENGLENW